MSAQQPTYEELVADVKTMKTHLNDYKVKLASLTAQDDDKDKEVEASFKQAKAEMDNEDKDKNAETDKMNKVKDAFKKAESESDPEKKKEAMKKAIEEKEDYEKAKKGTRKGQEEEPKKDVEKDAKIANLENKWKDPLVQKILIATKQIDPSNYAKIEKELKTASLEEVENKYTQLKPYMAAIGLEEITATGTQGMPTMIPFQAATALDQTGNPTDIMTASVDEIDFSKVPTKSIQEMYQ